MSKNEIAVFGRHSIVSQSGGGIHDAVNEYIGSRVLGDFITPLKPARQKPPHPDGNRNRVGANQFPGASFARWSPAPFTAHYFNN
jgi:hypothetical protein